MTENVTPNPFDDPEVAAKIQKVREKLGLAAPPATEEVAEEVAPAEAGTPVMTEDVIDWSEFDLDPNLAHFYPMAKMQATPEGPRWVVLIDVFEFDTAQYGKLGKLMTQRVNSVDQWSIATITTNGAGMGAVLYTRKVPLILPNPVMLKHEAELPPAPTDEELAAAEKAGLDWIAKEGQTTEEESDLVVPPSFIQRQAEQQTNPQVGSRAERCIKEPGPVSEAGADAAAALEGPDFGVVPGGKQEPEVDKPNG